MDDTTLQPLNVQPPEGEIKGELYTVSARIESWKVDRLDLIAFRRGRDTKRAHIIEEAIDQYLQLKSAA